MVIRHVGSLFEGRCVRSFKITDWARALPKNTGYDLRSFGVHLRNEGFLPGTRTDVATIATRGLAVGAHPVQIDLAAAGSQDPDITLKFERLLADEAFQGRDPALVLLEQVGGLNFVVESASLVLFNLYADQVSADIVVLRQAVERLGGEKLLSDLALELDAVCAVLGHGLVPQLVHDRVLTNGYPISRR
jgi:hypothetical protein